MILAQEERLLTEWQRSRAGFIRDGVISENDYKNSSFKIAFILKEVNAPGSGCWDLREICLDKQGRYKIPKEYLNIQLIDDSEKDTGLQKLDIQRPSSYKSIYEIRIYA